MHGQKLGQWVQQRESGGLALAELHPATPARPHWLQRHRTGLLLSVLAVGLLTAFWLIRERLSYPAFVQSALRGEIREIQYEIHPALWVRVTEPDAIAQIAGWLADARGGDRWTSPGNAADCQMRIHMADGRVQTLRLSPTGPFRAADNSLQPNYFLAEIHWGPHRRFNHAQLGISEIYRQLPAATRPDLLLLPPVLLAPGATQPATALAATRPAP